MNRFWYTDRLLCWYTDRLDPVDIGYLFAIIYIDVSAATGTTSEDIIQHTFSPRFFYLVLEIPCCIRKEYLYYFLFPKLVGKASRFKQKMFFQVCIVMSWYAKRFSGVLIARELFVETLNDGLQVLYFVVTTLQYNTISLMVKWLYHVYKHLKIENTL